MSASPQMLPIAAENGSSRAFDSVGRVLQQEAANLPVLEEDGEQRNWIFVTSEPGFYYLGDFIEINEKWIDSAVSSYETLQRRGYEAPVLAEHDSTVTEGRRLGDLVRLIKTKVEGRWALVAEVRWALKDAHSSIESGQIRYFSPAISAIEDDESGEVLEPVISELSVVAAPHQKTSTTHVLAKEADIMAEEEATVESRTTIEKRIDKLAVEIEAIAGTVRALTGLAETIQAMTTKSETAEDDAEEEEESKVDIDVDVDQDEDEKEDEEASEVSKLRVQLSESEDKARKLAFRQDQIVYGQHLPLGSSIELTQGVADMLFEVWRGNREKFTKVVCSAVTKVEAAETPQTIASPWGSMLGQAPEGTEPHRLSDEDLHKQCLAECDGNATKASKLYYNRKYGV